MRVVRPEARASTSPLMAQLFGEDLALVLPAYHACIDALAARHPALSRAWRGCRGRAGFLLPHMLAEYGHEARSGRLLSSETREAALPLGLQALAICVDDDVADGQAGGLVQRVDSVCAAELLQAEAWARLLRAGALAPLVQAELTRLLGAVTRYQHLDAEQIERAAAGDFRLADYTESAHKAGSLVEAGLRLGLALAGGGEDGAAAERFARRFGLAFQILDDVRDLDEDRASFGAPVTLPMLCVQRGEPLDAACALAVGALAGARAEAEGFGPGRRLLGLVDRLAEIVAKLRVEAGAPA
jgi:hypothetical protein